MTEIVQSMFSEHSEIKLEINMKNLNRILPTLEVKQYTYKQHNGPRRSHNKLNDNKNTDHTVRYT